MAFSLSGFLERKSWTSSLSVCFGWVFSTTCSLWFSCRNKLTDSSALIGSVTALRIDELTEPDMSDFGGCMPFKKDVSKNLEVIELERRCRLLFLLSLPLFCMLGFTKEDKLFPAEGSCR